MSEFRNKKLAKERDERQRREKELKKVRQKELKENLSRINNNLETRSGLEKKDFENMISDVTKSDDVGNGLKGEHIENHNITEEKADKATEDLAAPETKLEEDDSFIGPKLPKLMSKAEVPKRTFCKI